MSVTDADWLAQQHFYQCREERPIQDWIRKMKSQLPAQPEQEPDWYHVMDVHGCNRFYHKTEDCPYELKTPFYTTPPQRTWVGLTNEEMRLIDPDGFEDNLPQMIQQALKEKNT